MNDILMNTELLKSSTRDSTSEEFQADAHQYQVNQYKLRNMYARIPYFFDTLVSSINQYCLGTGTNYYISRALNNVNELSNKRRDPTTIVHDFNYHDPQVLKRDMGRHASSELKQEACLKWDRLVGFVETYNSLKLEIESDLKEGTFNGDLLQQQKECVAVIESLITAITPKRAFCIINQIIQEESLALINKALAAMNAVLCESPELQEEDMLVSARSRRTQAKPQNSRRTVPAQEIWDSLCVSSPSSYTLRRIYSFEQKLNKDAGFSKVASQLGYVPGSVTIDEMKLFKSISKLSSRIHTFKQRATRNLPQYIQRNIYKIANRSGGSISLEIETELMNSAILEIWIILEQWNTEKSLLGFASSTIKRVLNEKIHQHITPIDTSINNRQIRVRQLMTQTRNILASCGIPATDFFCRKIILLSMNGKLINALAKDDEFKIVKNSEGCTEALGRMSFQGLKEEDVNRYSNDVRLEYSSIDTTIAETAADERVDYEHHNQLDLLDRACKNMPKNQRAYVSNVIDELRSVPSHRVQKYLSDKHATNQYHRQTFNSLLEHLHTLD
jgi:hypothetical protein